jgi:hypothetical protein
MSFVERRIELDKLACNTCAKADAMHLNFIKARLHGETEEAEKYFKEYIECGEILNSIRKERIGIEVYLYDHPEALYADRS